MLPPFPVLLISTFTIKDKPSIKRLYYIFFILPLLFLSSCSEIIEEVNLNEDGSGDFTFTINLSQSKTKLASIMLMDSVNNYKVPDEREIDRKFDELLAVANRIEGIHQVKDERDFDNFIFSIECSFENVTALNQMADELKKQYQVNEKISPDETHFTYNSSSKTFIRNGNYLIQDEFNQLKAKDQAIFTDANYISICRFKENINTIENKNARISPSKKAVMLEVNAMDFINGKSSIANKIKLLP